MRGRAAAIALSAGVLLTATPAWANVDQRIQDAYERYGAVPACVFTSAQLETALRDVDTYGAQYFADFTDAVEAALASRASGACSKRAARPHVRLGAVGPAHLPSSPTSPTAASLPGPLLLMAVMVGLAALAVLALAALRWSGIEPRWLVASSHLADEAGFRLSARWEEGLDAWRALRARR
jgi:hypothetical protein